MMLCATASPLLMTSPTRVAVKAALGLSRFQRCHSSPKFFQLFYPLVFSFSCVDVNANSLSHREPAEDPEKCKKISNLSVLGGKGKASTRYQKTNTLWGERNKCADM